MKFRCLNVLIAIIGMTFNGTAFAEDRTVTFSTTDTGVSKSIATWGLDTAWLSESNIRRGIAFMGTERVDVVRISFTPTSALVNGDLQAAEASTLTGRLNLVDLTGTKTTVCINEDSPTIDPYFVGSNGYIEPARWAELIDVTTRRAQERGRTVVAVAPFNEPDLYRAERLASMQTFYDTAGVLLGKTRFNTIRISGGNTLNTDQAYPWYNFLKARLGEGNTHQLAGNFDNYASFFQNVLANGDHATNDELHNVMEAMVGAEYGLQTGIWWGTAERARGEFVKASDGQRLGYAEHRPNWTAASVYRAPDGKVQAFLGASERQAVTTSYLFVAKDRNVFFDGYGPQRVFEMTVPGGDGYGVNQPGAERVVNITWGDDIQPVVNGRYVLVNRNSGKVMEVAGNSTGNGANIQQNTYNNTNLNQQWDFTPQDSRVGGDFSYFKVNAVHSGKCPDVFNFSLDNSGNIAQWEQSGTGGGVNQQWFLDYAGDGWFYIRSKLSGKCIDVANASIANGANILQWDVLGNTNQQWRLLPVGAAIEFVAPAVPNNIAASANPVSVKVTWNANSESDLDGYTVLRSTASGGPYEIIARGITTTSFTDNSANKPVPYYYVVKAVDKSLNRSANSAQVSATPTGNATLVAQYSFNGNLDDDSINANDAMANGIVTYGTGKLGSGSLVLDGSSGSVSVPAEVVNFNDITISSWVYWDGGDQWQRIFDFGNDTNYYLFLTPRSGSNTLRFAIKNGGSEQIVETTQLSTAQWIHVAVTLGGTTAKLYVNGVLKATNTDVTINPCDFNPANNRIGKSQWPDPLFSGQIDDFRIYNYALSDTQIAAIKAGNTTPSFTSDPIENSDGIELKSYTGGLLASYAFSPDGDALTFSKDSGPEWLTVASDGTLSGTPWDANVGPNTFTVGVTNSTGLFDTATMTIEVANIYSGVAGETDLLGLSAQWLRTGCTDVPSCGGADLDGDADVDLSDFAKLAFNWLAVEGIELYLRLNETNGIIAYDSSFYDRSGVLTNGPVWSAGHTGGALSFDGTDDSVVIPGYKGVTGTGSRTCCAWVKPNAVSGEMVGWGSEATSTKWIVRVNENGTLRAEVSGGNIYGTTVLTDGNWHHIAVVLEDNGSPNISEARLYVDGVLETPGAVTPCLINTSSSVDVQIGVHYIASRYFNGLIDEVRIYNRALMAAEISDLASQ